jgi:hypothetical protein
MPVSGTTESAKAGLVPRIRSINADSACRLFGPEQRWDLK